MKRRSDQAKAKIFMGAVCLIGALAITSEAQAKALTSPWGNVAQIIRVGHAISSNTEKVYWIRSSDFACQTTSLGVGSLDQPYFINGPSAGSNLEIVSSNGNTWCGETVYPLHYGGWYFDLNGGGAADTVYNFGTGDTFVSGNGGADTLWDNRPGANISGGIGDDLLYAENNTSSSFYDLGDGNDCVNTFNGSYPPSSRLQCGIGTDKVATGTSGIGTNCESYPSGC